MNTLHLSVITPQKIVIEEDVQEVVLPAVEGEIGILPRHTNLFTVLKEGIVKIKKGGDEDLLAIGGGYADKNGQDLKVLVSHAYGQNEIDIAQTEKAINEAKRVLSQTKDLEIKKETAALLRRSLVNLKLIKRRKRQTSV